MVNGLTATALRGRKQASIESMIERNIQTVKENNDYLVKSYLHFDSGVISEAEYQMFKKSFNLQIETAEGNIVALRNELSRLEDDTTAKLLIDRFLEHGNVAELNRRVVAGLVKSVVVYGNNDVSVNFRYANFGLPHGAYSEFSDKSSISPTQSLISEGMVV